MSARTASPARTMQWLLPLLALAGGIALWEAVVRINDIPVYVLPAPSVVFATLVQDWPILFAALLATLATTAQGFIAAAIGGIGLALLFSRSKWLEYMLLPYAVILQVTPVIAIASPWWSAHGSLRFFRCCPIRLLVSARSIATCRACLNFTVLPTCRPCAI